MNAAQKAVGNTFTHPDLGLVIVDKAINRVKVQIMCIDRGTYDELTGTYKKVLRKKKNFDVDGRPRGSTLYWTHAKSTTQYGHVDECHISKLTQ
jgi:hypothetical protein